MAFSGAHHLMAIAVHLEILCAQHILVRVAIAQTARNPRQEFFDRERLDDVVVGPAVQPGDAIGDPVLGGQHDDRNARLGTPRASGPRARRAWAASGEHDEIGFFERLLQPERPSLAVSTSKPSCSSSSLRHANDLGIVLDEEDLVLPFLAAAGGGVLAGTRPHRDSMRRRAGIVSCESHQAAEIRPRAKTRVFGEVRPPASTRAADRVGQDARSRAARSG